jgi:hypothetical protein
VVFVEDRTYGQARRSLTWLLWELLIHSTSWEILGNTVYDGSCLYCFETRVELHSTCAFVMRVIVDQGPYVLRYFVSCFRLRR